MEKVCIYSYGIFAMSGIFLGLLNIPLHKLFRFTSKNFPVIDSFWTVAVPGLCVLTIYSQTVLCLRSARCSTKHSFALYSKCMFFF